MDSTVSRYPPDFRERMIELARAGRSPGSLAREFAPSEQTIRNWLKQADLDEGRRGDGLTTEVRNELRRLRQDNRRLRTERDILKRAVVWFARENGAGRGGRGRARARPDRAERGPISDRRSET